jgi:small conductance mechanosensitive channel
MNFTIYLTQITTNILLTIGIVVFVGLILFIERILLKKDDKIKGWILFIIYFMTFILLLGAVLSLFQIWGFDLLAYANDTLDNFTVLITDSIGRIVSSLIVIFVTFFILKFSKKGFKKIGEKEGPAQKRKKTVGKLLSSVTRYTLGIISIIILLSIWGVNVGPAQKRKKTVGKLLSSVTRYTLGIISIIILLSIWGVNVGPALAGLGIAGLVIGLGAQKFINDLIAGFFIIFEQHYDIDDVIEVQGFKGVVVDIGLKTTRIRNWKGDVKILANGDVTNLTNFSRNNSVAVVDFGIAYEEDIQKTFDLLAEKLPLFKQGFPQVVEDPINLGVVTLNASSVDIRVICRTLNEQHYGVERALRKYIKDMLDEAGIEIPFPQVVVSKKNES